MPHFNRIACHRSATFPTVKQQHVLLQIALEVCEKTLKRVFSHTVPLVRFFHSLRAWESIEYRLIPHGLATVATRESRFDTAPGCVADDMAAQRRGADGRWRPVAPDSVCLHDHVPLSLSAVDDGAGFT